MVAGGTRGSSVFEHCRAGQKGHVHLLATLKSTGRRFVTAGAAVSRVGVGGRQGFTGQRGVGFCANTFTSTHFYVVRENAYTEKSDQLKAASGWYSLYKRSSINQSIPCQRPFPLSFAYHSHLLARSPNTFTCCAGRLTRSLVCEVA